MKALAMVCAGTMLATVAACGGGAKDAKEPAPVADPEPAPDPVDRSLPPA